MEDLRGERVRTKRLKVALLSILVITSLAAFLLVTVTAKPLKANPDGGSVPENFLPIDDAEVNEGRPDQNWWNTDPNESYHYWIGYDVEMRGRARVYLKFDLSRIAGVTIDNAFLWCFNRYGPSHGESPYGNDRPLTVEARKVENDDWLEEEITWNTAPPMLDVLDTEWIPPAPGPSPLYSYEWHSWDVTSWVENQLAGDKIVGIGLKGKLEVDDNLVWFYSKESYEEYSYPGWTYRPRAHLTIYYSGRALSISIPPDKRDGYPGGTLVYPVTVKNVGTVTDSYTLVASDTKGWPLSFSQNSVGPLDHGESVTVTLSVTIPEGTEVGTEDTITVTATSTENTEVSASDTCMGRAAERISPTDDTYVHESRADQNFGGWDSIYVGSYSYRGGPIGPERAFLKFNLEAIPPGTTIAGVKLGLYSYTAPGIDVQAYSIENDDWKEDAVTWYDQPSLGDFLDTNTVSAEDKYYYWDVTNFVLSELAGDKVASFGLLDPNEDARTGQSASFDAKEYDDPFKWPYLKIVLPYDVDVYVPPYHEYQDNSPGGKLTYTITVTNRGTNPDSYTLGKSDTEGWPLSLPATTGLINTEENKKFYLEVTIPEDASHSTEDTITVTATSQFDSTVKDNVQFVAHAFIGPRLEPTDDTYVHENEPDIDHGSKEYMYVGRYFEYWENAYLKFDLSGQIPEGESIIKAELWLWCWATYPYKATDIHMPVCRVDDDSWTEDTVTWNDHPEIGSILDTAHVTVEDEWYRWDVTDFVREQFAFDNVVSLCVRPPDDLPESRSARFDTKEWYYPNEWPRLKIHAGVPKGVDVSISPDYQSDVPGQTLSYTVTVKNEGAETDTYTLENMDNAGWLLSLGNASLTVPGGENRTTTLTVTIPENAEPCTRDNITVIATSQENADISDNDTCTAHAKALGPGVDVEISPSENTGAPGDKVTFTVTVTNTGTVSDTYDLTAVNTGGWTLNIPPTVGPLENGASTDVTLEVTIPSTAGDGDSTTVTVTATSRENSDVSDSDTCTARAVAGLVEVQVTIDPPTKSGSAGGELVFSVVVKNTSGTTDTYGLTASAEDPGWGVRLSLESTGELYPDESRTIRVTVTIPENASAGDSTTVTVMAAGAHSQGSVECIAEVAGEFPIILVVGVVVVIVVVLGAILIIKPF